MPTLQRKHRPIDLTSDTSSSSSSFSSSSDHSNSELELDSTSNSDYKCDHDSETDGESDEIDDTIITASSKRQALNASSSSSSSSSSLSPPSSPSTATSSSSSWNKKKRKQANLNINISQPSKTKKKNIIPDVPQNAIQFNWTLTAAIGDAIQCMSKNHSTFGYYYSGTIVAINIHKSITVLFDNGDGEEKRVISLVGERKESRDLYYNDMQGRKTNVTTTTTAPSTSTSTTPVPVPVLVPILIPGPTPAPTPTSNPIIPQKQPEIQAPKSKPKPPLIILKPLYKTTEYKLLNNDNIINTPCAFKITQPQIGISEGNDDDDDDDDGKVVFDPPPTSSDVHYDLGVDEVLEVFGRINAVFKNECDDDDGDGDGDLSERESQVKYMFCGEAFSKHKNNETGTGTGTGRFIRLNLTQTEFEAAIYDLTHPYITKLNTSSLHGRPLHCDNVVKRDNDPTFTPSLTYTFDCTSTSKRVSVSVGVGCVVEYKPWNEQTCSIEVDVWETGVVTSISIDTSRRSGGSSSGGSRRPQNLNVRPIEAFSSVDFTMEMDQSVMNYDVRQQQQQRD